MHVGSESEELSKAKITAFDILDWFDNDIVHLINGYEIDKPGNAITLTNGIHAEFGIFEVYFEADPFRQNTYEIKTFCSIGPLSKILPKTKTLRTHSTIDPPNPRLLALRSAIAKILHASAAGEYINKILRNMDDDMVQSDGSTALGHLVRLRVGGWVHLGFLLYESAIFYGVGVVSIRSFEVMQICIFGRGADHNWVR